MEQTYDDDPEPEGWTPCDTGDCLLKPGHDGGCLMVCTCPAEDFDPQKADGTCPCCTLPRGCCGDPPWEHDAGRCTDCGVECGEKAVAATLRNFEMLQTLKPAFSNGAGVKRDD